MYLLDEMYIRLFTKLYKQIVGILMGTNCAALEADVFLFFYDIKIYDKRDDFDFDMEKFPFGDGEFHVVPLMEYIFLSL